MTNIQRDIFPQRGATSSAKPQFALPTINQIGSIYISDTFTTAGGEFTIPSGAQGDSVQIQLPIAPILGNNGRTGYFGNSTLVLGGALATTLDTEVPFIADSNNAGGDTSNLNEGEFMVDYETATIYGKRADNSTSGTAAYSYWEQDTNASVSVAPGSQFESQAAATSSGGAIAATNAAGGTQIVAANSKRSFTQCQNNGSVDVYFGAGTVTSSFPKVVANGLFTWHSQEALKVLSSGANCNIAFIDYINT